MRLDREPVKGRHLITKTALHLQKRKIPYKCDRSPPPVITRAWVKWYRIPILFEIKYLDGYGRQEKRAMLAWFLRKTSLIFWRTKAQESRAGCLSSACLRAGPCRSNAENGEQNAGDHGFAARSIDKPPLAGPGEFPQERFRVAGPFPRHDRGNMLSVGRRKRPSRLQGRGLPLG